MRLNKFIAENSEYSRRKADELIQRGDIFINGKPIKNLGTQIDPQKDKVSINGKSLDSNQKKIYIVLNKPAGYTTTRKDKFNKKTVMELVPHIPSLKPVGRLDKDTEGLLLLSNDGDFILSRTHPSFECEKEYFVEIFGKLSSKDKLSLEKGVIIDKKKTSPSFIRILKSKNTSTHLRITIHEGRNRQIRKMFASISHPVKYLKRIRIGAIRLGSLKKGQFRNLTKKELNDN